MKSPYSVRTSDGREFTRMFFLEFGQVIQEGDYFLHEGKWLPAQEAKGSVIGTIFEPGDQALWFRPDTAK